MLKIAFVIETLSGGGAERVTAILANEIADCYNAKVYIVFFSKTSDEYWCSDKIVKISKKKLYKNKIIENISRMIFLSNTLKTIAPDCVISLAMFNTNILLTFGNIFRKYKLILSERNDPRRLPKSRIKQLIRNMAYCLADGFVVQTPYVKKLFPGILSRKAVVIPNPIDDIFSEGCCTREKEIINCSRFDLQKNHKLLLESFKIVHTKHPEYSLSLYGDGPLKNTIIEYAKELGISDCVNIHGFSLNVLRIMRDSAIYVSSSDYEGISNSMLEALSMGIPTICTDCPVGGARMVISDYYNGILVETGNKKKLADAMNFLIENEDKAKIIGINAIASVKKYNKKNITKRWIKYIHKLNVIG